MSETTLNHTKIIATIGPASASPEILRALVNAGMNVCRLNFSHIDYAKATEIVEEIKKINADNLFPVALLADLQGPKLRVGDMGCDGAELKNDALVVYIYQINIIRTERSKSPGIMWPSNRSSRGRLKVLP